MSLIDKIPFLEYGQNRAVQILILLLSIDLVFFILHVIWGTTGLLSNELFSLEKDRGYAEFYQYAKELLVVALTFRIFMRTGERGLLAWALLFVYLLCDDSFRVHEQFGAVIAGGFHFAPLLGLRLQDFGELMVTMLAVAVLGPIISMSYLYGSAKFRRTSRHLIVFLILIAFFGVVVDMVHMMIRLGWEVAFLLGTMEDGGEMLVMSFMAWYLVRCATENVPGLSRPRNAS